MGTTTTKTKTSKAIEAVEAALPKSLKNIDLAGFIEYLELSDKIETKLDELYVALEDTSEEDALLKELGLDDLGLEDIGEVEEKNFASKMVDEGEKELEELEKRLEHLDLCRQRLELFLPDNKKQLLDELTDKDILYLSEISVIENTIKEPKMSFVIPGGCAYDIEKWEEEYKKTSFFQFSRRAHIRRHIKKLKEGVFIVEPVKNLLFETTIATDHVKSTITKPSEEVQALLDLSEGKEKRLEELVTISKGVTREELSEKIKQRKALKAYFTEYKKGIHAVAAQLISHISLPVGHFEPNYSYEDGVRRAEHFLSMNMEDASGVLSFFLTLIPVYENLTLVYSRAEAGQKFLRLLNTSKDGDGSQLLDTFYEIGSNFQKTRSRGSRRRGFFRS